jgi:hypothetical protein
MRSAKDLKEFGRVLLVRFRGNGNPIPLFRTFTQLPNDAVGRRIYFLAEGNELWTLGFRNAGVHNVLSLSMMMQSTSEVRPFEFLPRLPGGRQPGSCRSGAWDK